MNFLDSILNNMEKPPTIKKPEIKDKEKREKFEKMMKDREELVKKQKQILSDFRSNFERKLHSFLSTPINEDDPKTTKLSSKPMDRIYRTIVHEVCEDHEDLVAFSFGTEDIDRHCEIYKRGYEPCEEEIRALKAGVEYKPSTTNKEEQDDSDPECGHSSGGRRSKKKPSDKDIALGSLRVESAQAVVPGKQYGFVPVANKTDLRSVEQVIDDRRKLKKQKLNEFTEGSNCNERGDKSTITKKEVSCSDPDGLDNDKSNHKT